MNLLVLLLAACAHQKPTLEDVPAAYEALGDAASSAFHDALKGNWDAVSKDASDAKEAWTTLREVAEEEGAAKVLLVGIDVAIEGMKGDGSKSALASLDVAHAANTVESLLVPIRKLFAGSAPDGLMDLGPAARAVSLDAMEDKFVDAGDHLAQLGAAWEKLRPEVIRAGGQKEAKKFEAWMEQMAACVGDADGSKLRSTGKDGDGVISSIEQLFERR